MTIRPMQEATFLILTALANGSQHGYGIISEVAGISEGRVRLGPARFTRPLTACGRTG